MTRLTLIAMTLVGLLFYSCSKDSGNNALDPISEPQESASVSFYFTAPSSVLHLVNTATAMVSASDMDTIIVDLTVNDSIVTGTIEDIPAGLSRKFEIFVYDDDQTLTYYGYTFSDVAAGAVLTLEITLYPVNNTGTVIIVGTFAGSPPSDEYALLFDGNDDWIDVGDRDELEFGLSDFTISAWFKTEQTGTQQIIIRKGLDNRTYGEGRWVVKVHSTNVIKVVIDDIQNYAGSTLESEGNTIVTDGQWHHVAAVFDRDQALKVYLDGQLEIEDYNLIYHSAPIQNSMPVNVYIGRSNGALYIFDGILDEIRLWNIARARADIVADMNQHLQGTEAGLIAYWKMNEGEGQTVFDLAGNNQGQLGSTSGNDNNDPFWISTNFPYGN